MKEVEYVEVDNKNYIIVSSIEVNGITYVYMTNENDAKDFYIRKIIVKNGEKYYKNLDNEKEFNDILKLFYKQISHTKNC